MTIPNRDRIGGPPDSEQRFRRMVEGVEDLAKDEASECLPPSRTESRFRGLVELLPDPVFVHRDGVVVFANAACLACLGFTDASELVGRSVLDAFVHPDDRAMAEARIRSTTDIGKPYPLLKSRIIRAGGEIGYLETTTIRLVFNGEVANVVVARDVTERERMEVALRNSEARYRRLLETTDEGVCTSDISERFTFTNRRFIEMLGYGPGELLGQSIHTVMDGSSRLEAEEPRARRLQGISEGGELRLRRKDGASLWVSVESSPLLDGDGEREGTLSMVADISRRKEAEERLRKSEAQLRKAQELAQLGSFEFDFQTRGVTHSETFCAIFGVPQTAASATVYDFLRQVHADDRERVRKEILAARRERRPFTIEHRVVRIDVVRELRTQGEFVFDGAGNPTRLFGVAQDVTERKQIEARAALADRLASVGTLASGVAHEINNPLASVTANLDLMMEELKGLGVGAFDARIRGLEEMAGEARQGAERVRKIVRGLRTLSRSDDERRVPLDVRRILELSINLAFNEIRYRARLLKDFRDVPPVVADEARLGQVFINLLFNAAQVLPDGGADRNELRLSTFTDAEGRAVVEVRDTGPGIAPDILGRIFDPFFTTKAIGSGTGLGLSICHSIVTSLGGTIQAESELGKGSVFRVVLPSATLDVVDAPPPRPLSRPPTRRGRVLVVDDDAAVRGALRRVLSSEHDVTVLPDAREALSRIVSGERYDVVLCDLMMPEMTGMDLHAELSAIDPEHADRIIFITGGAFSAAARTFLDQVPNHRFEKPFDVHNLRAVVRDRVRPLI